MNNFREGLNALREISDPEKMKMALERITGKKLADYEGIDALVASLMRYYNDEVKKKQNKQDNALETIAKEIVPAINENYETIQLATTADVTKSTNIWSSNVLDSRNENYLPGYYGVGVRHEFKDASKIGLGNSAYFVGLTTIKKWSHESGGTVDQIATNGDRMYIRSGTMTTNTWSPWSEVFTTNSAGGIKTNDNGGYIKYPDGRLEAWGATKALQNEEIARITLHIAFKDKNSYIVTTSQFFPNIGSNADNQPQVRNLEAGAFEIYSNNPGAGVTTTPTSYAWHAIGWWK